MKNTVLMGKRMQNARGHEKNRGMNSTLVAKFAQEKKLVTNEYGLTEARECEAGVKL